MYVLPDETIRKISDDYATKMSFESGDKEDALWTEAHDRDNRKGKLKGAEREEVQRDINAFFKHWHQKLHKETREPFDDSTTYSNPNYEPEALLGKDLYLARRLISPVDYKDLRTVMVGDDEDISDVRSDPQTPLIMISSNVHAGNWGIVSSAIDELFSNAQMKPWEVYEKLLHQSSRGVISIDGIAFSLDKKEKSERVVMCP